MRFMSNFHYLSTNIWHLIDFIWYFMRVYEHVILYLSYMASYEFLWSCIWIYFFTKSFIFQLKLVATKSPTFSQGKASLLDNVPNFDSFYSNITQNMVIQAPNKDDMVYLISTLSCGLKIFILLFEMSI